MARLTVMLTRGALRSAALLTIVSLAAQPTAIGARAATGTAIPWTLQAKLLDPSGALRTYFGQAVALSAGSALIGAPAENKRVGVAYVFTQNGSSWSQQQALSASDGAPFDSFGWSVALDGDTALVGAPAGGAAPGAAYVFVRRGATWTQQAELRPSDPTSYNDFGWSVALSGNGTVALVGAPAARVASPGAVYVFTRSGTTWTQQAELTPATPTLYGAFGWSVALSSGTALVGAPGFTVPLVGAAYVFTRSGTTWTSQAELRATGGATGDNFGGSVALSGTTALIGASGTNGNTGAAYLFGRSGATWTQQAELTASDGVANDLFGGAVALSGGSALIGAPILYGSARSGKAYFFEHGGASWTQQAEITAPYHVPTDFFGVTVALDGPTALVGSPGWNDFDGAAYFFTRGT